MIGVVAVAEGTEVRPGEPMLGQFFETAQGIVDFYGDDLEYWMELEDRPGAVVGFVLRDGSRFRLMAVKS